VKRRLLSFLALPALVAAVSPASRALWAQTPAEPVFDPSSARMLFSETFDSYTFETLHPKCGGPEPARTVIDHAWYYCKQFSPGYDAGVVTVPGHSGLAVQFHYEGKYQESHGLQTSAGSVTPTGKATTVVQYWARFAPDPGRRRFSDTTIIQIKNIMMWHDNNTRFQMATSSHSGNCPIYGPSYTMVGVQDQAQVGCESDQPIGPFFASFANGQWHRWTIYYKPNSVAGARDGVARLWLDGVLVVDLEKSACGITPPGGWKPWCDVAELDALYSGTYGVGTLEWGGPLTAGSTPFTVAIDDLKWWAVK
jgi:hypothetical protein